MTIRLASIAVAVAVATTGTACEEEDLAIPVFENQDVVFGDSLGDQINATPITEDGRVWRTRSGADLGYWQTEVDGAIYEGANSITLALSSNDAGTWTDGWTDEDDARWRSTIDRAHDAGVCVAAVLPWFTPDVDARFPGVRAEIDEARAAILAMPLDGVVDWAPVVKADPSVITIDGIHLAAMGGEITPPVEARYQTVDAAANTCGGN